MKKILTLAVVSIAFGVAFLAPIRPVEAQVILGTVCCDSDGNARCVINPTPLGYPCWCFNQGKGYTC